MRRGVAALLLALATAGPAAAADGFPSHPVRIIVPFGPGSGSDIVARRLGLALEQRWKQSVVIDNRPGAQGMIGTEALKSSAPDGYTLGISTNSTHAVAPYVTKNLPYDTLADFEHICLIGVGGAVALVPKDSPFRTLPELAAYARAHPGDVFFGHADTISQIPGELLRAQAGIPMQGVPYKASTGVVTDLIGGRLQLAFFNYMTATAQVATGLVMPMAVTEAARNPRWPDVPAVSETYPGFEVRFFVGISAPRGVPPEIVAAIRSAIEQALQDPALKRPLEDTGLTFLRPPAGGYRGFIAAEAERWRAHLKAAGIVPQ
ncbi:MAG TPA: tripartite tricarboxylate transporter substrate binding protein [Burkholderiales bacterium]|nr:tripartite tricarboxylate transporter substrate binding protein [Burkholderiales bacterium]